METKRFFVRNIPDECNESDISNFFKKLGTISAVSVAKKPTGSFAFFTAEGLPKKLCKASQTYSSKEWSGCKISLEEAKKESFLERLRKERVENDAAVKNINPSLEAGRRANGSVKNKFEEINCSDNSDAAVDDDECKGGIKKFTGTEQLHKNTNGIVSELTQFDSMWADSDNSDNEKKTNLNDLLAYSSNVGKVPLESKNDKKRAKIVNKDMPHTKEEKKRRDDDRRRQSLAEKSKLKLSQQTVIKTALSSVDSKPKKIVFDDADYDIDVFGNDAIKPSKVQLFDDEDLEDVHITDGDKYAGEQGHKLLKLQAQFNYDARFKMDKRFLEDEHNEDPSSPRKLMAIGKSSSEMIRFDPTKNTSDVAKTNMSELPNKKAKRLTLKQSPSVSKEKFYNVDTTHIKSALKTDHTGFSLLDTYGDISNTKNEFTRPSSQALTQKILKKNPLIDDSSDDERGNYDPNNDEETKDIWAPKIYLPSGSGDNFFFKENDALISEAIQFLNQKNSEEAKAASANYDNTRRTIKKILKTQQVKRNKKVDMFKKKVGGMKSKGKSFPLKSRTHIRPKTRRNIS